MRRYSKLKYSNSYVPRHIQLQMHSNFPTQTCENTHAYFLSHTGRSTRRSVWNRNNKRQLLQMAWQQSILGKRSKVCNVEYWMEREIVIPSRFTHTHTHKHTHTHIHTQTQYSSNMQALLLPSNTNRLQGDVSI